MTSIQLYQGLRVGSVELVVEVEPRDSIDGSKDFRQWEVLCDCGGRAFRTVARLTYALKHNQDTCCEKCLQELRRGFYIDRVDREVQKRKSRSRFLSKWFQKTGSLYSDHFYDSDPGEEPTGIIQVDTFSLDYQSYKTDFDWVNPDYLQQDQWLTPLSSPAGWVCYHCEKPFAKGFGCVRCLAHLCDSCKTTGAHCCPRDWAETWKGEVKDNGLLARRIQLLNLNPLKLTTPKDIKDAKRFYRESYAQWKREQQQIIDKENRNYARQLRHEAMERKTAEFLEQSKKKAEAKKKAEDEKRGQEKG